MEKIEIKHIDEYVYHDQCDNGLNVYMWVNEKVNNFYMTYNCKYGSIHSEFSLDGGKKYLKVPNGIAHFLEHVNFNEPNGKTAHDYYNKLGSSINAFTTFEYTSYEVYTSNFFKENLIHLLDYVTIPCFTKENVDKERNIIIEEIKMDASNPGQQLYYGTNKSLFHNDQRKNLITGEIEDVQKITAKDLNLVHENFYHPKNMFLIITGNFNPEEAMTIIKEHEAKRIVIPYRNPIIKPVKEPLSVVKKYNEIKTNVEIPKVKVSLKLKRSLFKKYSDIELRLILDYILRANFGSTSDFKEELLQNDLITSIGYNRSIVCDKEIVIISIISETYYPEEIVKKILEKLKYLVFDKDILKRRRRANIASLINDFDDIEYVNENIQDNILDCGYIVDNWYDLFSNITLNQVEDVISLIDVNNYAINVLVPNEEKNA